MQSIEGTNSQDYLDRIHAKINALKEELKVEFERHEINDVEVVVKEIEKKQKEIIDLEKSGKIKIKQKKQQELEALKHYLTEEISKLENQMEQLTSSTERSTEAKITIDSQAKTEKKLPNNDLLERMFEFSKSMPICFERSLARFLYYASIKSNLHDQREEENLKHEIEEEIKLLEQCLIKEESIHSNVGDFVKKCYNYIEMEDWKSAVKHSKQIFKEIKSLDIQEMLWLVKKAEDASESIKDKNIILFLGGTGAGKSTTVHFLAGSKMKEKEVNGMNHIAPVDIKNPSLKKVTTSPSSQSETRYISCVPVNYIDVGASTKGSIMLCDTPGFEDTTGPEVEIANGIGIVKAIKKCKSVKPVVLISHKSIEDRLTGLRDLVHMLVGMISGLKEHMAAFSYFFTKYPEKERKNINAWLKDIHSKLDTEDEEEEADDGFDTFIKDMIRKTRNKPILIDPISGIPGDILDNLAETAKIQYPDAVFRYSITEKSKAALNDQITKHQLSIISATKYFDYDLIKYKLDELKAVNELLEQNNISQTYLECIKSVSKHLIKYCDDCTSAFNHGLKNENPLRPEDVEEYKTCIERALKAKELRDTHLKEEVFQISKLEQNMNVQVARMLLYLKKAEVNDLLVKRILDKAKLLSSIFVDLEPQYKEVCKYLMDKFKSKVESSKKLDYKSVEELSRIRFVIPILQEHLPYEECCELCTEIDKVLQLYSLLIFNDITQKVKIDYVLAHLDGSNIDKDLLLKRYQAFDIEYRGLVSRGLDQEMDLSQLVSSMKLLAGNVDHDSRKIIWDSFTRSKIPRIVANVFALWTLKNSTYSEDYLFQPRAAQVVAIFRMLGIGDKGEEFKNNIVEIQTGEGKSIVLAVTACVLALLGFDVSCACYSDYLSQRDFSSFHHLFDSLGLLDRIQYGTLNKICENIINQNGDIRKRVEECILQNENKDVAENQPPQRPKILLIDEVDVFFSKEFYVNDYTPFSKLVDPTIKKLIDLIWRERNKKLSFSEINNTPEYKACCSRFQNWNFLIEEAVNDMLCDVQTYDSHDYFVKDDKIGYIEQDEIVFNVSFGYKTIFAYYSEYEMGQITEESLNQNIYILVKCGNFSYSKIPFEFENIMGVTGNLRTLSEPEKNVILGKYEMKKVTLVPKASVNNLRFSSQRDIKIENNADYFCVIAQEIRERLCGLDPDSERAILVFFESKKKLFDFYYSGSCYLKNYNVAILTEESSSQEKEYLVKNATCSGQITLATRIFGRGTDFKCYDPIVAKNQGVHVIQTFLSEDLSEETQIKGRTARQGESGSYSMVLLDSDLEKFPITVEEIHQVRNGKALASGKIYHDFYEFLTERRNTFSKSKYEENSRYGTSQEFFERP